MSKAALRISALASALLLAGSLVGCGVDTTLDTTGFQAQQGLTVGQMAVRNHTFGYNIARARMMRQMRVRLTAPGGFTGPSNVDLRSGCSPVADQGQLGSCTAFGMGKGLREFIAKAQGNLVPLSPLFLYYNERVEENSVNEDSGATIADGMNSLKSTGICPEQDDPYNIAKFKVKPSAQSYTDASKYKIPGYNMIGSLDDTKAALASGKPVVIGFTVYESFENIGSDGVMPMPAANEGVLGGHCVLVVGYDDSKQQLIVRNSWGTGWGASGYFYMPYAFYTPANVSEMAIAN